MKKYKVKSPFALYFQINKNNLKISPISKIPTGSVIQGQPVVRTISREGKNVDISVIQIARASGGSVSIGYVWPSEVTEIVAKPKHLSAEGATAPAIKGAMDTAKNIVTDRTVLTVAGVGLGTGLALSWLMGVRGGQMAGITASTTILGGWVGYGFSSGSYSSADGSPSGMQMLKNEWRLYADGKGKPSTLKENVCGKKNGTDCEVKFEDGTVAVKGTWGVNARGKCACIGGGASRRK